MHKKIAATTLWIRRSERIPDVRFPKGRWTRTSIKLHWDNKLKQQVCTLCKYAEKIFASHTIKIKLDTEADICILIENQMWLLSLKPKIRITNTILKGYGCSRITSIALTDLNIMLKNKTVTRFDIVNTPPKQLLYFWMKAGSRVRYHLCECKWDKKIV